MPHLSVMEIFFGSPWPAPARLSYAKFLRANGYATYLYGPKADPFLRKRWREDWPDTYRSELRLMSETFRREGVKFGVCFSPMGYHEESPDRAAALLADRLRALNEVGIDTLGLFFDDMPVHAGLAETQLTVVREVRKSFGGHLLFCPSFYTPDPILDKVFGARPPGYLEALAAGLPADIEIAWTGPKVISPEIPAAHLAETRALLGRAPSLCDNFFANDGPKNCKFLKLKPLTGRSAEAFAKSSSWYFNPMNQAELSKVALVAAALTMARGMDPAAAWDRALAKLCSPGLGDFLRRHGPLFLSEGLDKIPGARREELRRELAPFLAEPVARDVDDFLGGAYTVGSECLTD